MNNLVIQLPEHLGNGWSVLRPEDIRLDIEKIRIMRATNNYIVNERDPVSAAQSIPTFTKIYEKVMLREIQERIPDGSQS